jgi:hypothetical protein
MNRNKREGRYVPLVVLVLGLSLLACTFTDSISFGPTAIPTIIEITPGSNTIAGRVWHDLCANPAEGEPLPFISPEGCVDAPEGSALMANGTVDGNEIGIQGVEVLLGEGTCPSIGYRSIQTGPDGFYFFAGLYPGTYCVSIDPVSAANSSLLLPGRWTAPEVRGSDEMISFTVTIDEDNSSTEVSFGWDYQNIPLYEAQPTPTLTATVSEAEPSATITPTLAGTATPTLPAGDPRAGLGAPAFQDGFSSGSNWPLYEDEHARFEIGEDELIMTAFNPDYWNSWMLTSPTISNFYLEMEAEIGSCSGLDAYGLMARSKLTDDGAVGYLFGVSCDGRYSLRIWDGSEFTKLINWTVHADLAYGSDQTQRIGLWAEGETLKLYINGHLIAQVPDSTYASGRFGVFVSSAMTAGVEVRVNNVSYWDLP